jgi:N-acetylmuramoyl-L-alanine amidase
MNKQLLIPVFCVLLSACLPVGMAFCFLSHQSFATNQFSLNSIEMTHDQKCDYVDILTDGDVKAKGLLIEKQLIITLPQTATSKDFKLSKWPSKRIKSIVVRQGASLETEVIINLKKDVDYEIASIFGRGKTVVEIYDRVDVTARLMAAWEKKNLEQAGDKIKDLKINPVTTGDHSLHGKIIVLDPGHGGRDPGAITSKGIPEKVLTLQTAKLAADLLSRAGATVYLTRGDDRTCNLRDIVNFADKTRADIFICIHYNFNSDRDIAGTETYYYNSSSRRLALSLHGALIDGVERKDRGLRREMFYTIHHTTMPAALLELAYLSNAKEEELALSPAFQAAVARSIARGVKIYF